ncbi:hypothetical protein CLU79DRAFT_714731 [Phycomyces nitens]|nr:hypothetical protein CLU79DRAFT_714731 [Phycomyces nitens]
MTSFASTLLRRVLSSILVKLLNFNQDCLTSTHIANGRLLTAAVHRIYKICRPIHMFMVPTPAYSARPLHFCFHLDHGTSPVHHIGKYVEWLTPLNTALLSYKRSPWPMTRLFMASQCFRRKLCSDIANALAIFGLSILAAST